MSVKKSVLSKIGNGKVVADYLPQVSNFCLQEEAQLPTEEKQSIRIKLSEKAEKRLTCPVDLKTRLFGFEAEIETVD